MYLQNSIQHPVFFIGVLVAGNVTSANYAIRGTSEITVFGGQISDTSFSLEAWICPTKATAPILGHYALNDNFDEAFGQLASVFGYKLEMIGNLLKFTIADDANDGDETFVTESVTGTTTIPLNRWTHVAAVYDKVAQTIKVFVNGKVDGTAPAILGCSTSGATNMYLAHITNDSGYFDGFMDEVRMWNQVKTASDFKQGMFKLLTGSEANLKLYFDMDEGTGTSCEYLSDGSTLSATVSSSNWAASGAFSGPRNALEFDGIDDYITMSPMPSYTNSAITIEAWIKTSSSLPEREICSWSNNSQNNVVEFRVSEGKFQFGIDAGGWVSVMSSANVNTNEWTHVAAVKNGNTVTLYINGKQDASGTVDRSPTVNQFHIGALKQYGITRSYYFPGFVDEVRIWNVVRSQADIQSTMMKQIAYNETGLVACYRMDETDGTSVYDITSNACHGTMTNMDAATDRVASTAYNTWIGATSTTGTAHNWSNGAVANNQNVGFHGDNALNPLFGATDKYHFNNLYNAGNSYMILRSDATGTTQISVEKEVWNPGEVILRKTFAPDRWYFFSLPHLATYEMITTEGTFTKAKSGNYFNQNPVNDQYYLLYYDGDERNFSGNASASAGLNWVALYDSSSGAPQPANTNPTNSVSTTGDSLLNGPQKASAGMVTIQAGKGYIMAVPSAITLDFHSPANTTNPFKKANLSASVRVDAFPNANPIHRHWNLVGNLYQKGFDLAALDQDTYYYIYNNATQTYDVKEATDAYQLDPNGAFFMQAGASTVNFAESGKVFKAPAHKEEDKPLRIILELSGNQYADKTEIRFAESASTAYVINEDAVKFLSFNPEVPQLWSNYTTIDYAVQQRPLTSEIISLGVCGFRQDNMR